jgi:hypothetical protein
VTRLAVGGGIAVLAFGAWQLATVGPPAQAVEAVLWLGAVLLLHDGLLSPLAAGAGTLLSRHGRRDARWAAVVPVLATGLSVGAVLLLVALPALLGPGAGDNATVLPRPYARGLLTLLGLDAAVTTGVSLGVWWWRGRSRSVSSPARQHP